MTIHGGGEATRRDLGDPRVLFGGRLQGDFLPTDVKRMHGVHAGVGSEQVALDKLFPLPGEMDWGLDGSHEVGAGTGIRAFDNRSTAHERTRSPDVVGDHPVTDPRPVRRAYHAGPGLGGPKAHNADPEASARARARGRELGLNFIKRTSRRATEEDNAPVGIWDQQNEGHARPEDIGPSDREITVSTGRDRRDARTALEGPRIYDQDWLPDELSFLDDYDRQPDSSGIIFTTEYDAQIALEPKIYDYERDEQPKDINIYDHEQEGDLGVYDQDQQQPGPLYDGAKSAPSPEKRSTRLLTAGFAALVAVSSVVALGHGSGERPSLHLPKLPAGAVTKKGRASQKSGLQNGTTYALVRKRGQDLRYPLQPGDNPSTVAQEWKIETDTPHPTQQAVAEYATDIDEASGIPNDEAARRLPIGRKLTLPGTGHSYLTYEPVRRAPRHP
jgi:hypothetical protein